MNDKLTLKIQGMHCDACKSLIEMEIEELNLQDQLQSISYDSDQEIGEVILDDINEGEKLNLKSAIESLGNYKIIE